MTLCYGTHNWLCVQKMLSHGLNHGLFISLFKLISCPILHAQKKVRASKQWLDYALILLLKNLHFCTNQCTFSKHIYKNLLRFGSNECNPSCNAKTILNVVFSSFSRSLTLESIKAIFFSSMSESIKWIWISIVFITFV